MSRWMSIIPMTILLLTTATARAEIRLEGYGASFPNPLYQKWCEAYNNQNGDVKIDYQSVGSRAGINFIIEHKAHFAGTDAPLTTEQEKLADSKLIQLPTVAGAVAIVYNLPDLKEPLILDGPTLADIYLGKVKKWNDDALKKLNPTVDLPNQDIAVLYRADGTGTTFIFTSYLAAISKEWAEKIGAATSVKFPVGQSGPKSDGVASLLKRDIGTIGYIDLDYATQHKITYATMINKDGKPVRPSLDSVEAAATECKIPDDLKFSIVNAPGEKSYPIAGYTFLLIHADLGYLKDKTLATELLKFIQWCETNGQKLANNMKYAKLPKHAQDKVLEKLKTLTFNGEVLLK